MKKFIFSTILILSSIVILLLPKDIIPKSYEIEYGMIGTKRTSYIYYLEKDMVIGVPVEIQEDNKFKLIELVFKYLTEKSNSVNPMYHTCLKLNSKLLSFEIRDDDIYLEVTSDFFEIDDDDALYALAQVLYTYKELGFTEVFITQDNQVIKQMADVILYDGLTELPVNLDISTSSSQTKTIKIEYYYKNQTKSFINHIINANQDETKYIVEKLINFVNKEYNTHITLINLEKNKYSIKVELQCNNEDSIIIKELLLKNLDINEQNIIITE